MKKITIAALIMALLTGLVVYNFAKSLERAARPEYTEVLVAAKPIADRTIITADMVVLKQIPSEVVLETAIRDPRHAVGFVSAGMIEQGEVVSLRKIHAQGSKADHLGFYIPEGRRAVTIEVDMFAGVGGFIIPGDRVDILVTMAVTETLNGLTEHKVKSFMLAQDIEVLASGTLTKAETGIHNIAYNSITLALNPQEALSVAQASSGGKISLALRSGADSQIVDYDIVSPDNIIP
jgi:pilus assembly protein CpaB